MASQEPPPGLERHRVRVGTQHHRVRDPCPGEPDPALARRKQLLAGELRRGVQVERRFPPVGPDHRGTATRRDRAGRDRRLTVVQRRDLEVTRFERLLPAEGADIDFLPVDPLGERRQPGFEDLHHGQVGGLAVAARQGAGRSAGDGPTVVVLPTLPKLFNYLVIATVILGLAVMAFLLTQRNQGPRHQKRTRVRVPWWAQAIGVVAILGAAVLL